MSGRLKRNRIFNVKSTVAEIRNNVCARQIRHISRLKTGKLEDRHEKLPR